MNTTSLLRLRWIVGLLACHYLACGAFLLLREPIPEEWRLHHDLERASFRSSPGMSMTITDAYMGHVACRQLRSWSSWHGGESVFVKALELLTWPSAFGAAVIAVLLDDIVLHYRLSFCAQTWLAAWLYVALSTIQWVLVGSILGGRRPRSHAESGV